MISHAIAIAAGGALGAVSRYGVNLACARWLGDHFAFKNDLFRLDVPGKVMGPGNGESDEDSRLKQEGR